MIAKGVLFLAPLHLKSLYARYEECVGNVVRSVGRYDVDAHVESCFLPMLLWERFSILAPKLMDYPEVVWRRRSAKMARVNETIKHLQALSLEVAQRQTGVK